MQFTIVSNIKGTAILYEGLEVEYFWTYDFQNTLQQTSKMVKKSNIYLPSILIEPSYSKW